MNGTIWRIIQKVKIILFLISLPIIGQNTMIDGVVAVIGDHPILLSDIENQYQQLLTQNPEMVSSNLKCKIFEELMFQKLLLVQAERDSIEISAQQVEAELDSRLRYFISQIGSKEQLEEFYGKTILEIKEEFRKTIKEQLLAQQIQQKIGAGDHITPAEVKAYFKKIPADSIPLINTEIEIGVITQMPKINEEEKIAIKDKLETLRSRILQGESFKTLAIMYSEDPGSARNGGELGFIGRGELVPEFEAVAFSLKEGELSEVFETQFGYHIIQLIERRGEQVNVKHILLTPKPSPMAGINAKNKLDSIVNLIQTDSITFEKAAIAFSDDNESKNNAGLMINPISGNTRFEMSQLDHSLFYYIDKLEVGEISTSHKFIDREGNSGYRILIIKSRTEPHQASLKTDYNRIQDIALQHKKKDKVKNWIVTKSKTTYIRIDEEYLYCDFSYHWSNIVQ